MRALRAAAALLLLVPGLAGAEPLPSGDDVVARVNARDDGAQVSRRLLMELTDRRGNVRTRETRSLRKDGAEGRKSAIFFEAPKNVKDTAFLTFDYPEAGRDDDQWLYLPALRKTRRIAGADRGGAFVGTDFSYEDIKKGTRIGADDYVATSLRREDADGHPCIVIELVPVSDGVSRELGYGKVLAWVDTGIWLVRKAEYWDERGRELKTVRVLDVREVQGIWTPHRLEAESAKGHRTTFVFSEVDYRTAIPEDRFTERALRRGMSR